MSRTYRRRLDRHQLRGGWTGTSCATAALPLRTEHSSVALSSVQAYTRA
jgi:hypothetical protein